ncbi:MAG TPA: amidohydrolase family protein [Candidatus Acidoferrales bacterium]|nr:amidohydrolase family protein [Candidatus Acidoferrales bacterium]
MTARRTQIVVLILYVFFCAVGYVSAQDSKDVKHKDAKNAADTVVLHGRIYTLDSKQPWAQAVAIRGDKIVAVGDDTTIEKFSAPRTKIIDAAGQLVLPGFVDSHSHFFEGSIFLNRVHLDGAKDLAEIRARLTDYAKAHPGDGWIVGTGWDYAMFGQEKMPNKKYLDDLFPKRPVFLDGFDGHTAWVNSAALAAANISKETPEPAVGSIVRDPQTGEPTGALREDDAIDLVKRIRPEASRAEKLAALRAGIKLANENGLTRIHAAGGHFESNDFDKLELYAELRRHGELTLRMYIAYFLNPPELRQQDLEAIEDARKKYSGDWISAGVVKLRVDGVIESHTAAMIDPYSDDPALKGKLFWDPAKYNSAVAELDKRRLQLFTHAIGDLAVRTALDAYQHAEEVNHSSDRRPRIEHIETVTAADIPRFGKLGVIASMQPLHAYPDADTMDVWARNVGPERASRGWSWKSIADTGGRYAFGSDWPVVTLNPWYGLQTAVTRQTREGTPEAGFVPSQRLTVAQAVEGYTLGAAFAGRREKTEGSLEKGKLADLIIVSQNIFEIDAHKISETKVRTTIVGGHVVYRSDAK